MSCILCSLFCSVRQLKNQTSSHQKYFFTFYALLLRVYHSHINELCLYMNAMFFTTILRAVRQTEVFLAVQLSAGTVSLSFEC